jgi:ketosteroid isomerase-like protein
LSERENLDTLMAVLSAFNADDIVAASKGLHPAQGDAIMMYMHVRGSRPDGRTYDNEQAYLYRFKDGKLIEGQTIPVDQHAFEEFFTD